CPRVTPIRSPSRRPPGPGRTGPVGGPGGVGGNAVLLLLLPLWWETAGVKPIRLAANRFPRFYRGGSAIDELRGTALDAGGAFLPEDWVGSTTTAFGSDVDGLTRLEDGRTLREAVAADPEGFLGPEHTEAYGDDPALLVKLLHAGERPPVHCHPDRAFSRRHLDCPFGKTEAWVVVEARGEGTVHLGFRFDVDAPTLSGWVARQET